MVNKELNIPTFMQNNSDMPDIHEILGKAYLRRLESIKKKFVKKYNHVNVSQAISLSHSSFSEDAIREMNKLDKAFISLYGNDALDKVKQQENVFTDLFYFNAFLKGLDMKWDKFLSSKVKNGSMDNFDFLNSTVNKVKVYGYLKSNKFIKEIENEVESYGVDEKVVNANVMNTLLEKIKVVKEKNKSKLENTKCMVTKHFCDAKRKTCELFKTISFKFDDIKKNNDDKAMKTIKALQEKTLEVKKQFSDKKEGFKSNITSSKQKVVSYCNNALEKGKTQIKLAKTKVISLVNNKREDNSKVDNNIKKKIRNSAVAFGVAVMGMLAFVGAKREYDTKKADSAVSDFIIKTGKDSFTAISDIEEEQNIVNDTDELETNNNIDEKTTSVVTEDISMSNTTDSTLEENSNTNIVEDVIVDENTTFTLTDDAVIYSKASDIGSSDKGYQPKYKDVEKSVYKIIFDLDGETISVLASDIDRCLELKKQGATVIGVGAINDSSKTKDGDYVLEGYYSVDEMEITNNTLTRVK